MVWPLLATTWSGVVGIFTNFHPDDASTVVDCCVAIRYKSSTKYFANTLLKRLYEADLFEPSTLLSKQLVTCESEGRTH